MTRKLVTTARGKKLDMAALKAANPHVKPVGKKTKIDAPNKPVETKKSVRQRIQKISGEIPAPLPVAGFVTNLVTANPVTANLAPAELSTKPTHSVETPVTSIGDIDVFDSELVPKHSKTTSPKGGK